MAARKPMVDGGVAEWLKAHAWKVCIRETVSRVRIPLPPERVWKIQRVANNPKATIRYRGKGPPPPDLRSSEDLTDADIRSFAAQAWHDWQGWIVAPLSSANPEWLHDHAQLLESDRWEQYQRPLEDHMLAFSSETALFLEQRGLFLDLSGSQARILTNYLFRAGSEAYRRKIERIRNISTYEQRDCLFDDVSIAVSSQLMGSDFAGRRSEVSHSAVRAPTSSRASDNLEFLSELQRWLVLLASQGMKPRQLRQYESDLRSFAAVLKIIGNVRRERLQSFYEEVLSGNAPNTVSRKFSVIRSYWRYLVSHDLVSRDHKPFEGLLLPTKKTVIKRRAWTPAQVCELWYKSKSKSDEVLAQAIMIAAFTGSRIEAICSLSTANVFTASDGKLAFHFSDKTDAGIRDVPVHSSIMPLIQALLMKAPLNQGFLIKADTANQYDDRSTGVGKRFARLRTEQGHSRGFDFHSIRRTVVSLLAKAHCPEAITADIVGHEKPTMTYGLYNDACDIEEKRRWLEVALIYPDTVFMRG